MTTSHAIQAIQNYKSNPVIMGFVTSEAREKVAAEIRAKTKSGTTAKAVALLEIRHPDIAERVQKYIASGLIGCYLASLNKNKLLSGVDGLFN